MDVTDVVLAPLSLTLNIYLTPISSVSIAELSVYLFPGQCTSNLEAFTFVKFSSLFAVSDFESYHRIKRVHYYYEMIHVQTQQFIIHQIYFEKIYTENIQSSKFSTKVMCFVERKKCLVRKQKVFSLTGCIYCLQDPKKSAKSFFMLLNGPFTRVLLGYNQLSNMAFTRIEIVIGHRTTPDKIFNFSQQILCYQRFCLEKESIHKASQLWTLFAR